MESKTRQKNKKQIIYEAAARLFRDKGYVATSMRDLAQAVDLQASSLYNHIGSKEEILRHICFANAQRFLSGMQQVEAMDAPEGQKVRELIRLHIRIATEDVTSVTAFNDEWRHLSEPHLNQFIRLRRDYQDRFRAILELGIRKGEFKALDPSVILYSLFSSMRWLYDWFQTGRSITAEEIERNIITLLMEGISKSEVRSPKSEEYPPSDFGLRASDFGLPLSVSPPILPAHHLPAGDQQGRDDRTENET